ncbi:MAG: hypothetical protein QM714_14550 [Nocardioides sp.]|uniref:hypothetical protein n=1 Tax=Nocardioides sp. TaxID=35761 RepID=UPI0039E3033F
MENTKLELPEGVRVEKFYADAGFQASVYDFLLEMPCDGIGEFAAANRLTPPSRDRLLVGSYLHQAMASHKWLRHQDPFIKAHGNADVLDNRYLGVSVEDVRLGGSCTVVYTIVRD